MMTRKEKIKVNKGLFFGEIGKKLGGWMPFSSTYSHIIEGDKDR